MNCFKSYYQYDIYNNIRRHHSKSYQKYDQEMITNILYDEYNYFRVIFRNHNYDIKRGVSPIYNPLIGVFLQTKYSYSML